MMKGLRPFLFALSGLMRGISSVVVVAAVWSQLQQCGGSGGGCFVKFCNIYLYMTGCERTDTAGRDGLAVRFPDLRFRKSGFVRCYSVV